MMNLIIHLKRKIKYFRDEFQQKYRQHIVWQENCTLNLIIDGIKMNLKNLTHENNQNSDFKNLIVLLLK